MPSWLISGLHFYSELFSAKVSPAGVWDVGGNEVAVGIEAEVEAGELLDVMMERREALLEGTADLVVASFLAFLLKKRWIKMRPGNQTMRKRVRWAYSKAVILALTQ